MTGEDDLRLTAPDQAPVILAVGEERGRGGSVGLTVDLSGVTHLSSAGVSALHHVAGRHAEQKAPLRLRAPAGTPAQVVLDLVALPHDDALART